MGDNDPRLPEEEKLSCEGSITKKESRIVLATMARNKVGGISGFTAEFFAFFWNELGDIIVGYINSAKHGQLFVTHMRGALKLITKKGDQKLLMNKRPICLLDVIYKLIAKVPVTRMNKAVAAEGIFEWGGGGQTSLRGPLNRRGPLWEPKGPYFSDLPSFHQRYFFTF